MLKNIDFQAHNEKNGNNIFFGNDEGKIQDKKYELTNKNIFCQFTITKFSNGPLFENNIIRIFFVFY